MEARPIDDPGEAAAAGFNMTPMIDVVFQLIIFLMLANDMSRRDIEDLDLPAAFHAAEDDAREPRRLIVNLLRPQKPGQPPLLKVRGQETDLHGLQRILRADATGGEERFVLIRADRECRWQDVQWLMQALADPAADLRVHRLQFATHRPLPGE